MRNLICAAALLSVVPLPLFAQNAQQAACQPLTQVGSIPLTKDDEGLWRVPVGINGTPKTMALNLSLATSAITPETVEQLQLPTRRNSRPVLANNNGERSLLTTRVSSLSIGNAGQFTDSEYSVNTPLPNGEKRPDTAPAGDLALDILSHFDFDLDFNNGVMNLFRLDHCEGKVVYWKTDAAVAVPFMWSGNGQLIFGVKVGELKLWASLSSRNSDTGVNLRAYRVKYPFNANGEGVEEIASEVKNVKVYQAKIESIDLGGIVLNNPMVKLYEDTTSRRVPSKIAGAGGDIWGAMPTTGPDVIFGTDTMAKLHIYVASKEQKMYISPAP